MERLPGFRRVGHMIISLPRVDGRQEAAVMRAIVLAAAMCIGFAAAAAAQNAKTAAGEKLFVDQKCTLCHSVGDKGNKKGALDDVGSKLSADEIRQWITTPKEMTAKAKATRKP